MGCTSQTKDREDSSIQKASLSSRLQEEMKELLDSQMLLPKDFDHRLRLPTGRQAGSV